MIKKRKHLKQTEHLKIEGFKYYSYTKKEGERPKIKIRS